MVAKKAKKSGSTRKPRVRKRPIPAVPPPPRPVPPNVPGLAFGCEGPICPPLWDWPDRIQACALNMIEGRKGDGKSSVCAAIAAHMTGGPLLPGAPPCPPRPVMWIPGEETWHSEVMPRLVAAGGDPAWICQPDLFDADGRRRQLTLPADLEDLAALLRAARAGLLVLDPFTTRCDPGIDLRVPQQARRYLESIRDVMGPAGVTVLLTRNLKKGQGGDPREAGYGSAEVGNVCRTIHRVDSHPAQPGAWVFACVAKNQGAPPPALVYGFTPMGQSARIDWRGESDLTADVLAEGRGLASERDESQDAQAILRGLLGAGRKLASTVAKEAREAGVSDGALRRAKAALRVRSERQSAGNEGGGQWYWVRPERWPGEDAPLPAR